MGPYPHSVVAASPALCWFAEHAIYAHESIGLVLNTTHFYRHPFFRVQALTPVSLYENSQILGQDNEKNERYLLKVAPGRPRFPPEQLFLFVLFLFLPELARGSLTDLQSFPSGARGNYFCMHYLKASPLPPAPPLVQRFRF